MLWVGAMQFIIAGLGNFYLGWQLTEKAVPRADGLGFYGALLPDHYMWDRAEMPDNDSTTLFMSELRD